MNNNFKEMKYKIVKKEHHDPRIGTFQEYGIYEVYYNTDNEIMRIADRPVSLKGNNPQAVCVALNKIRSDLDNLEALDYNKVMEKLNK